MSCCRDFYDANAVAYEIEAERYTNYEPPTLCDCGSMAEHGQVYCKNCLDTIDITMQNAVDLIMRYTGFDQDNAEQAICHWLENTEEFIERQAVAVLKKG